MTPSEIKPSTFRLVAQYLNQLCHRVTHIKRQLNKQEKMNFFAISSHDTKDNTRQCEFSSPPAALRQCLGSSIRYVRNHTPLKME
jgi:hypothetical protein